MSFSFTCPCCRAHLKVRDESSVGQKLECPECQAPLMVATTATGEIFGQQLSTEKSAVPRSVDASKASAQPEKLAKKQANLQAGVTAAAPRGERPRGSRIPTILASSVAVVFSLVLLPFLLPSNKSGAKRSAATPDDAVSPADDLPPAASIPGDDQPETVEPTSFPDTPDGRLAALGKVLRDRARRNGHFPAGTVNTAGLPLAHRWSWQAQIASELDNPLEIQIDWGQKWNDPAIDRFVRRSIPRFQNSLVELQTSEDKYPAAHFVGIAGVGEDAPTLPVNHPRAGIFGQDRQTKFQDIRDGLSNTMLLGGVEQRVGAWAEGVSSYRAFTREPYIHGPDGFGTGQKKSMLVLMADGSVREISSQIDPVVVRRMAAMNDGFPLDPQVPGEPSDPLPLPLPLPETTVQPMKVQPTPADPTLTENPRPPSVPADAVKPQDPPLQAVPDVVVDIPKSLGRKILNFDQTKPVAAYQLLLQIEELAGVRIEYDREKLGAVASRLDKQITLRMKNATLEDLLSDILKQIELGRQDEKSKIQIVAPQP